MYAEHFHEPIWDVFHQWPMHNEDIAERNAAPQQFIDSRQVLAFIQGKDLA